MKSGTFFLFASVLLTGFLGGIGFVNAIGFIPAVRDTPAEHVIRYWQNLDRLMSARMPIFAGTILLAFIGAGFFLIKQPYKQPFWFLILALVFVVADIIVASKYNFPLNRLIQSSAPGIVPDNFEHYRQQSVFGFNLRSVCMIGAFISTLTALFLQSTKGLLR